MTKVLLTNFHLGNGGGHTTYINYVQRILSSDKFEVFIGCPSSSKLYKKMIDVSPHLIDIEFPAKLHELFNTLKNILKLKRLISENQINLVHVNGNPDHKVVALTKLLFKLNFKIIRTKHDANPIGGGFIYKKLFHRFTDHIIVVSDFQFNNLIPENLKAKTIVIKNGIDLEKFKPLPKSKKIIENFQISQKDIVLVSNAGTTIRKCWHLLVDQVSKLDNRLKSKVKVVLIGEIPDKKILQKYVYNKNMENNVYFTGLVEDVRPFISVGDFGFVLSNKVETISYACREMMAMKKPVLITNCGGLPENIIDGINGRIIDVDSGSQIYNFLESIETLDIELYGDEAYRYALKNFGLDKFNAKLMNFYKKISLINC